MLRANCEKPEYYVNEKVRGEVMRHFGYFMTESTGHLSEYVPWFRSQRAGAGALLRRAGLRRRDRRLLQVLQHACRASTQGVDYLTLESAADRARAAWSTARTSSRRSETDVPFRLNGNVRNDGYITNLPQGCCVEVPVFVDRRGLHPVRVGALPPQCAALNQSNVTVQTLAVEAAFTGDPGTGHAGRLPWIR